MSQSTIGESLRRAREAVPASLFQAAHQTKIRVDFLQAMERDSFRFVPGAAYVKGMLRSYAKWLRLDDEAVGAEFDRLYGDGGPSVKEIVMQPAQRAPGGRGGRWVVAGGVAASVLVVMSLLGLMHPAGPGVAQPPSSSPRTEAATTVPGPVAQAAPPAQGQGVAVTVVAGDRCWMRVITDNASAPIYIGTMAAGASKDFSASSSIRITFGNLGAVRIQVNGRDLGTPGAQGQTGTLIFDRSTTSFARG
jgi:cytoskeleton protein RodZ